MAQNIPNSPYIHWPGKPDRVISGPARLRPLALYNTARQWNDRWHNLLVHADNHAFLSSLACGSVKERIDQAGGVKLAYIDPPFAVGTDFTIPLCGTGEPDLKKIAGISPLHPTRLANKAKKRRIYTTLSDKAVFAPEDREEAYPLCATAYSDTWEDGLNGFLSMIYERLVLLRPALAPDASVFVHCDWRAAPHMRLIMDELFGQENFLGDIVWHYTGGGRASRWFSRKHDRILHYSLSDDWTFNRDAVRVPYKETSGYAKSGITGKSGKHYSPHPLGTPVDDVWDIPMINPLARERNGYPTQKPLALLERIISAASNPGDIVMDVFCGSGTTAEAAERLGRRWIMADSSPFAVNTLKKRIIALPEAAPFLLARMDSLLSDGRSPNDRSPQERLPGSPVPDGISKAMPSGIAYKPGAVGTPRRGLGRASDAAFLSAPSRSSLSCADILFAEPHVQPCGQGRILLAEPGPLRHRALTPLGVIDYCLKNISVGVVLEKNLVQVTLETAELEGCGFAARDDDSQINTSPKGVQRDLLHRRERFLTSLRTRMSGLAWLDNWSIGLELSGVTVWDACTSVTGRVPVLFAQGSGKETALSFTLPTGYTVGTAIGFHTGSFGDTPEGVSDKVLREACTTACGDADEKACAGCSGADCGDSGGGSQTVVHTLCSSEHILTLMLTDCFARQSRISIPLAGLFPL